MILIITNINEKYFCWGIFGPHYTDQFFFKFINNILKYILKVTSSQKLTGKIKHISNINVNKYFYNNFYTFNTGLTVCSIHTYTQQMLIVVNVYKLLYNINVIVKNNIRGLCILIEDG